MRAIDAIFSVGSACADQAVGQARAGTPRLNLLIVAPEKT